MTSDGSSDVMDFNSAAQLWETRFDQIGNCPGIFIAKRVTQITFAVIIQSVLCMEFHLMHNGFDYFAFRADLKAGNKLTLGTDVD